MIFLYFLLPPGRRCSGPVALPMADDSVRIPAATVSFILELFMKIRTKLFTTFNLSVVKFWPVGGDNVACLIVNNTLHEFLLY